MIGNPLESSVIAVTGAIGLGIQWSVNKNGNGETKMTATLIARVPTLFVVGLFLTVSAGCGKPDQPAASVDTGAAAELPVPETVPRRKTEANSGLNPAIAAQESLWT